MGEDKNGGERAATHDLLEVPVTLETINGKLDHLIVVVANVERLCMNAVDAAENARDIASKSKTAALRASNSAIDLGSRRTRFVTTFAGAAFGGALVWVVLTLLGLSSAAVAISSCGAH
jgi:hypothetical protein